MDVTPSELGPDDRDLDDGGLDLTPRADGTAARSRATGRRWGAVAVLVLLGGVAVFIFVQARGATLYYKNADEAVAQKAQLGSSTFRLQGVVVGDPKEGDGDQPTTFTVAYKGVAVKVVHTGTEPALFKAGLPVVVEGHWNTAGTAFDSSRLLVKHTEDYKKADKDGEYEKEHPDRVKQADETAKKPSS
ncbi:cytochrome c maturation protein CcmE [Aquihabitans sp. G128]|uniref:cytochrome c maturation protein CcmE domain-containing protein n=1 Tax=Aquihabitans sp. G128 TaxID=2849779 RepID=UPI001C223B4D|nr:cytochrome c maturation protein CcmE [Aquihabitans sp. G128]QXC60948.1 cytochrome c maturation protein CcmE [Aquihabitans sp. G128]